MIVFFILKTLLLLGGVAVLWAAISINLCRSRSFYDIFHEKSILNILAENILFFIVFLLTFILHFGLYLNVHSNKLYLFKNLIPAIISFNLLFFFIVLTLTYKSFRVVKYVFSSFVFFLAIYIYNYGVDGEMVLNVDPFVWFFALKLGVELVYDGTWYGVENFKSCRSEFFWMLL